MLHDTRFWKVSAAVEVFLVLDFCANFFSRIVFGMKKGDGHDYHAGIADRAGAHAEVILGAAEHVASDDLAANLLANECEEQRYDEDEGRVHREVSAETAEH